MTKNIDTSQYIPEDIAALGRTYLHRMQRGMMNTAEMNNRTYQAWRDYLFELALGSFEWEGLPPEIDPRFIEYVLITRGCGGFFAMRDGTAQWAFAPATPAGKLNMYYNPNKVLLQPVTGGMPWYRHAYYWAKGDVLYEPNAALCWDRLSRRPFLPTIELFARRLSALDRTVDVNVMAQKTPFILTTNESGRQDAQNLAMQITGNAGVVTVDEHMVDNLSTSVLNLGVPYVADKLLVDQSKIINTFLSMCGVDNSNTEKRERMIDAEATSNNEQIMIVRKSRQRARDAFCQQVATLTGGQYTPVARYTVPYRVDGSIDMGGAA